MIQPLVDAEEHTEDTLANLRGFILFPKALKDEGDAYSCEPSEAEAHYVCKEKFQIFLNYLYNITCCSMLRFHG